MENTKRGLALYRPRLDCRFNKKTSCSTDHPAKMGNILVPLVFLKKISLNILTLQVIFFPEKIIELSTRLYKHLHVLVKQKSHFTVMMQSKQRHQADKSHCYHSLPGGDS